MDLATELVKQSSGFVDRGTEIVKTCFIDRATETVANNKGFTVRPRHRKKQWFYRPGHQTR